MRILWMSDNPTSSTGLGNITRFVCAGLARLGHQVSIIGWQKRGHPLRLRCYTVYPVGDYESEGKVLLAYLRQLHPDVLVTLSDPWRVSYIVEQGITRTLRDANILWAHYYPIDRQSVVE